MPGRRLLSGITAAAIVVAAAGGCGQEAPPEARPRDSEPTAGSITVLAAASLTEAFGELGRAFHDAYPATDVRFSFGASSTLAQQAIEGAPADVFASADEPNMAKVADAGAADASSVAVFARNRLALLVGRGNPKGITGLADVARPDVVFVSCAAEVPCGRFAAEALTRAGFSASPRSYEENVKAVVAKVSLGEADAGIVYATDARAVAGAADTVDIPDAHNVVAAYPIAVLRQSKRRAVAEAFRGYVLSGAGRGILARHGFLAP